jgi:hypothetical protein
LAMTAFAIPLPRRLVDLLKRRNSERDMLIDHLPILRGRSRHHFDLDVSLRDLAQPGGLVQRTNIPGQRTGT